MVNYRRLEQSSVYLSLWTNLSIAVFGISFGLWIRSDAVMLDGFFNLVNFFMAIATLWITGLLQKPENKVFNFGYAGFAPLLNLCKGLLVFGVSIFAFAGSVGSLLSGGKETKAGIAILYAAIAATTCLIVALFQRNLAKKSNSPIVKVDADNWLINGAIGLSVGVAFALATWLQTTPLKGWVPYADPTIVIVLVLLAIPIPIKVILTSFKQLMLGAPAPIIQNRIKSLIQEAIQNFPCEKYVLRMTEAGQVLYLHFYWLLPITYQATPLQEIDQIRESMISVLHQEFPDMIIDILFTQDAVWFSKMNEQRGIEINHL
ncbi:MAG: cation transporter [Snowella sp.]|nr:cation transporter [Snowella sp.]